MIRSIKLKNFKCFENETIPLASLSVLSGVNGMGKSTVLQSLLMLRQSLVSGAIAEEGALLNGPLVSLGSADDVLYENADHDDVIEIGIFDDDGKMEAFEFKYKKNSRILPNKHHFVQRSNALSGPSFYYLQAERLGPRNSFPCYDHELVKYNKVGNAGEYCAHLLSANERSSIAPLGLLHDNASQDQLLFQVEAWLSEVGQTPRIHLNDYPKMDATSMEFSFVRNGISSMNYRASNVGFGLTYSLPIFVSCLSCEIGGLVLIENPEAHLHPKGQVAVGKFLARAAANGIQVIVETHSDHVLNGIRIAVKNEDIHPGQVALHFFDRLTGAPNTTRISPQIDRDGRLNQWPDGFFDSWEKGLAELL